MKASHPTSASGTLTATDRAPAPSGAATPDGDQTLRPYHCPYCDRSYACEGTVETARVPCNVRAHASDSFTVWRCPDCSSIHSRDNVDLAGYYKDYPFHGLKLDLATRIAFRNIERRLRAGGVQRTDSIIDYGCGSGVLIEYLKRRGYSDVAGFDAYSDEFNNTAVLERTYDGLIAQDLIEHVDNPVETLQQFSRLVKPGGMICIGTPNALGIELNRLGRYAHYLHQPYHRHIVSKVAMLRVARDMGWDLVRYFPTAYANTFIPFINPRTWLRYAQMMDNTLDLLFEPIHFNIRMLTPAALFDGVFGGLFCPEVDVTYLFRTRERVS